MVSLNLPNVITIGLISVFVWVGMNAAFGAMGIDPLGTVSDA